MKRLLVGIMIGVCLSATPVLALRVESPPTFQAWDSNAFTKLNNFLLQVWNVLNGRYTTDVSIPDPDGTRRGEKGELLLYDPGASEELCVNVDGETDWDCTELLDPDLLLESQSATCGGTGCVATATCSTGRVIVYGGSANTSASCNTNPSNCSAYCTVNATSCSATAAFLSSASVYIVCADPL